VWYSRTPFLGLVSAMLLGTGCACSAKVAEAGGAGGTGGAASQLDSGSNDAGLVGDAGDCCPHWCMGSLHVDVTGTACDIALSASPSDSNTVIVTLDCAQIQPLTVDGGSGWVIDYTKNPAHLILLGNTCDTLQRSSPKNLVICIGCFSGLGL
jgi:hypothetical protein